MRILVAHNYYKHSGGEDSVVATESELLRSHGHSVELLTANNDHIHGFLSQVRASFDSIYSLAGKRLMQESLGRLSPDVVHVHNFFPKLSPAVFDACSELGIPVVHTIHNYRTVCASGTLFRDGRICEECIVKRSFWPGVRHACYRSSVIGSAVSGTGMAIHDLLGTWQNKINAYIALTQFAADTIGHFRIPKDKIHIKANSVGDQGLCCADGKYALFVGRLTVEKGIDTILEADAHGLLPMETVIVGDGPLRPKVEEAHRRLGSRIRYKGFVSRDEVTGLMKLAKVLIFPSLWYEGLPLVILEAFSMGLPVVAADQPNIASLISHEQTGILYNAGAHHELAAALSGLLAKPSLAVSIGNAVRKEYLDKYTHEANYTALLSIYTGVLGRMHSYG